MPKRFLLHFDWFNWFSPSFFPNNEIVDKLSRILNIKEVVNPDKSEILDALVKYENSGADIVGCILAAKSSPQRVMVSFDKDFKKLKAASERL